MECPKGLFLAKPHSFMALILEENQLKNGISFHLLTTHVIHWPFSREAAHLFTAVLLEEMQ